MINLSRAKSTQRIELADFMMERNLIWTNQIFPKKAIFISQVNFSYLEISSLGFITLVHLLAPNQILSPLLSDVDANDQWVSAPVQSWKMKILVKIMFFLLEANFEVFLRKKKKEVVQCYLRGVPPCTPNPLHLEQPFRVGDLERHDGHAWPNCVWSIRRSHQWSRDCLMTSSSKCRWDIVRMPRHRT